MAILIHANGVTEMVYPKNGKKFKLEELQKYVGGYIEHVPGTDYMLVDEDGLSKKLPFNVEASNNAGMRIVGDALLCQRKEV